MLISTSICVLATGLFYVNDPVVDMREAPSKEAKVVSQTLFSEEVHIVGNSENWVNIRTPDGYAGWIPSNSLVTLQGPYETTHETSRLAAHLYAFPDTEYGPVKTLPYGSKLKAVDTSDSRWLKIALPDGREAFIQRGDVEPEPPLTCKGDLVPFANKFLGLPYTWGGRSSFGYDCSGFVQMLYSKIGVNLQRDAKQQINDSRLKAVAQEDLEPGDLVFFGITEQRIGHVGMFIGNGQFIHATVRENKPWIRISSLDDFEWSGSPEVRYPYRAFLRF